MTSSAHPPAYALPPGYRSNQTPEYFDDASRGVVFQPHVYELASYLVERGGLRTVIDIGAGNGAKLRPMAGRAEILAIDHGPNLARLDALGFARVLDHDVGDGLPDLPAELLDGAVVIASDILEHLPNPIPLLEGLARWAERCPFVLLSTPDRTRVRGAADEGPPANPSHVREWNLDEFARLLRATGLRSDLIGYTVNTDHHDVKSTMLAIAGRHAGWQSSPGVSALAIVHVYNEEDIVGEVVRHLLDNGVDVHIVDNWSTDGTVRALESLPHVGERLTISRFPEQPTGEYEWHRMLSHTATLAAHSGYDWVIHHDADELRAAPWRGIGLRDAIGFVDALGYTAVDFTVVDFRPVDGRSVGATWEQRLRHFEFGRRAGHFLQVKAWKQRAGAVVDLASSGGHDAMFDGRVVYPLKFLCRHYPLRSVDQASRKVFADRASRIGRERRERGWHAHYDEFRTAADFHWDRLALHAWSDVLFDAEFLVERLTGIGIPRTGDTIAAAEPPASPPGSPRTCATPNQHARAASLRLTPSSAVFTGYQDFVLCRQSVRPLELDATLTAKHQILEAVLTSSLVSGRTVLDLGANGAFFSFLCLQRGASEATAVDIDHQYVEMVGRAAAALGFDRLRARHSNAADWHAPADVVVALALVHWLYNCTAQFGDLDAVVAHLAGLTRYALVVEWVDPDDPAIVGFGHLEWSTGTRAGAYDRSAFEQALSTRFARVEPLGGISPTRHLYLARVHQHAVDLTCPLPLLHDASSIVSCSRLTTHDGIDYWSRVYDLGDTIVKQTTGRLAAREGDVLTRVAGSQVPRVLAVETHGATSVLRLAKVYGTPWREASAALGQDESRMARCLGSALDAIEHWRALSVAHRDVLAGNVLVCRDTLVFLDFGWATAPGLPVFTPAGFDARRNGSDVQAIGRLFLDACPSSSVLHGLLVQMAHEDPRYREDDPRQLRAWLDIAMAGGPPAEELHMWLDRLAARDDELAVIKHAHAARVAEVRDLLAQRTALEHMVAALEGPAAPRLDVDPSADWHAAFAAGDAEPLPPGLARHAVAFASALRARQAGADALRVLDAVLALGREGGLDDETRLVATYSRASLLRERGDVDGALAMFRTLAAGGENVPARFRGGAMYHIAAVLASRGDSTAAGRLLRECLGVLPGHGAARELLDALDDGTIGPLPDGRS